MNLGNEKNKNGSQTFRSSTPVECSKQIDCFDGKIIEI